MSCYEKIENGVVFRFNGETVRVTAYNNDAFRVESAFFGEIPDDNAALYNYIEPDNVSIELNENYATLINGKIKALLYYSPKKRMLQITFKNDKDEILLQEIPSWTALKKFPRDYKMLEGNNFKLKLSFISDPNEKIYGMGQYQQEFLNLKGCSLELAHRNSQASIPFYISTKGYGFMWNNPSIGEVNFSNNVTQWVAENTNKCDYWIVAGDTPKEIEQSFAEAVGKTPMMPEYGLGFWQCKLRYYNQDEVINIAKKYKKRNIPLDVLVVDFYHWRFCGDWKFEEEFFPDPKKMVNELKKMGIETMVSFWPQVDDRSENYEALRDRGCLVRSNGGIDVQMQFHGNNTFFDPTNPYARKFVWDIVSENYYKNGIKTFWLDEAEPEFGTYDYELYRYFKGPVTQVGNVYPRDYAKTFYEGLKSEGQEDIVSLIRCAWLGSQRYGALVWSGDVQSTYEDFRKQICAGINTGLAGIPWWTTDIGGFANGNVDDPVFRELLVRWFQFGTFCPVMRLHGCRTPAKPIYDKNGELREITGADNEIWCFGEENERIMTKFINIRTMIKDYVREQMTDAHLNGNPIIRGLFYEFPEDAKTYDIKDEYMFGSDILVAPVCYQGENRRSVYLPAGAKWTHAGTGKIYEGGKNYEIDAPLDTLPIFLKDGKQDYLIGKI